MTRLPLYYTLAPPVAVALRPTPARAEEETRPARLHAMAARLPACLPTFPSRPRSDACRACLIDGLSPSRTRPRRRARARRERREGGKAAAAEEAKPISQHGFLAPASILFFVLLPCRFAVQHRQVALPCSRSPLCLSADIQPVGRRPAAGGQRPPLLAQVVHAKESR